MSQQFSEISPRNNSNSHASDSPDQRVVQPSTLITLLAMFSGAGFLYLLLPYELVPQYAGTGNLTTLLLASIGVVCAVYGWSKILSNNE